MKYILGLVSVAGLLAVTGCRSSHPDSYSRGYEAGHYAAGAGAPNIVVEESQPPISQQPITPDQSQINTSPGGEAQGGAAAPYYYGGQSQGQWQRSENHQAETPVNTTTMPSSAFRGTDEHWYNMDE
jgi:hypothetical protein